MKSLFKNRLFISLLVLAAPLSDVSAAPNLAAEEKSEVKTNQEKFKKPEQRETRKGIATQIAAMVVKEIAIGLGSAIAGAGVGIVLALMVVRQELGKKEMKKIQTQIDNLKTVEEVKKLVIFIGVRTGATVGSLAGAVIYAIYRHRQ